MTWRKEARRHIEIVVKRVGLQDKQKLKAELKNAYPFGERRMFPYKVWCEEVRKVLKPNSRIISTDEPTLFQSKGKQP